MQNTIGGGAEMAPGEKNDNQKGKRKNGGKLHKTRGKRP